MKKQPKKCSIIFRSDQEAEEEAQEQRQRMQVLHEDGREALLYVTCILQPA